MLKLYELPENTFFMLDKVKYLLDHIDGMYSFCYRCFDDEVVHISAYIEVTKCD